MPREIVWRFEASRVGFIRRDEGKSVETRRFKGTTRDDATPSRIVEIVERGGMRGIAKVEIAGRHRNGDRRLRLEDRQFHVEPLGREVAFGDCNRDGRTICDPRTAKLDRLGWCARCVN